MSESLHLLHCLSNEEAAIDRNVPARHSGLSYSPGINSRQRMWGFSHYYFHTCPKRPFPLKPPPFFIKSILSLAASRLSLTTEPSPETSRPAYRAIKPHNSRSASNDIFVKKWSSPSNRRSVLSPFRHNHHTAVASKLD